MAAPAQSQSQAWVVVTGGSGGLGAALTHELAAQKVHVIAVARRAKALDQVRDEGDSALIHPVVADIALESDRQMIAQYILKNAPEGKINAVVHNAAVLNPGKLSDLSSATFRESLAVNVEAPLFLTQLLLPHLDAPPNRDGTSARVLHISSGLAHGPEIGQGSYCVSKAALFMLYQQLREELTPLHIAVGSARPGIIDTPMQEQLRGLDPNSFPAVERFKAFKTDNKLMTPQLVARFLSFLLLDTSDVEFSAAEWDVRDETHHARWWHDKILAAASPAKS